jgi:hypothetical protein
MPVHDGPTGRTDRINGHHGELSICWRRDPALRLRTRRTANSTSCSPISGGTYSGEFLGTNYPQGPGAGD